MKITSREALKTRCEYCSVYFPFLKAGDNAPDHSVVAPHMRGLRVGKKCPATKLIAVK
jgi:hypothetical protein